MLPCAIRRRSASGAMSTISIWSARRTTSSGIVSRCSTPLIRCDHVVERLQVLDVDRGDDVDAGVEQRVDVLPALLVPAAGDVGVRQLVDQGDRGSPGEHGVEVHLLERRAAVARARAAARPRAPRAARRCARGRGSRRCRRRRRCRGRAGACPRRAWRRSCPPRVPCRGRRADVRGSRGSSAHCPWPAPARG